MEKIDFLQKFAAFDAMTPVRGYMLAIDAANEFVAEVDKMTTKLANAMSSGVQTSDGSNSYVKLLGALGQLWKDDRFPGIPQHPSSLGQMLVLGGLGSLGGYYAGKMIDRVVPNDAVKASRAGAVLGGLAGMSPGLASAVLLGQQNKTAPPGSKLRPVWTDSFWQTKESSFGLDPYASLAINVNNFQNMVWNDPAYRDMPIHLRAAASGLVQGAANLPGKHRNSSFVTPMDIARVSVGMGSGLASGWLVGKTFGALFGTGKKTQKLLQNTGMGIGALKTVVPLAYGQEPFSF